MALMPFSHSEIERRRQSLWSKLKDIDAVVVPSFHGSYYLSGLPIYRCGRWAITCLLHDKAAMIVPQFEEAAAARTPVSKIYTYTDAEGPSHDVATAHVIDFLISSGAKNIGVEAKEMPASMYIAIREALPNCNLIDITSELGRTRLIYSEEELTYIEEGARLSDLAMGTVMRDAVSGVLETALCRSAMMTVWEERVQSGLLTRTNTYLQQGERSIEVHADAFDVALGANTFFEVTAEADVWHYFAGVERPIVIGEVPEPTQRAITVARRAHDALVAALRPGKTLGSLDRLAREIFVDAGYKEGLTGSGANRHVQHYIGSGRIDLGDIQIWNEETIKSGMVLSIEPCTAVPGVGSPRICNMFLVTEAGARRLTHSPDIISVPN